MRTRAIGGVAVSAIGLGGMPLSTRGYLPDESQAIRTVHAALDAGITLIDTADAYAPSGDDAGHNERLIAAALARRPADRDRVLVATKGGHTRTRTGGWDLDGSREYLVAACERSLRALNVEAIGLYQHHRPDPRVPYEESIGALLELVKAGKIRMAGISNASVQQIRVAREILGPHLVSVQNEFSPRTRSSEPELHLCEEYGIAFLPWSPLGGIRNARGLGGGYPAFAKVAASHGVSPQQVCLAWELAKSPVVIPIPGASRPDSILDSARAAPLVLQAEQRRTLDQT
jgi:aryl-alcohol dehydrogenase-like predicted oxidoreductase